MVGRLLLLKLLHLKRLRERQNRDTGSGDVFEVGEGSSENHCDPNTSKFNIKTEKETDRSEADNMICRVCLKEGHIPIFDEIPSEDYTEPINTFTCLEITPDDEFPKFLCTTCQSLLQGAILLRKTAQESNQLLRKTAQKSNQLLKKPKQEITDNDDEDTVLFNYDNNDSDEQIQEELPKKYHCNICDIDFNTAKDLNLHRRTIEHHNMKYHCPICKKSFTLKYYKKHIAYHKLDSPYICDFCGKTFKVQNHFARHRMIHGTELPFQCDLCPYKGRFSESVKMHMRTHTGEKPYQCHECPVRCINKSNLNRHMHTHTKEYTFRCDTCGKGFFTKRDLTLHLKVDHTGIKDHVCNICGKAFGYRKQMMKHQLKVHKRAKLQSGRTPLYLQIERKKQLESRCIE